MKLLADENIVGLEALPGSVSVTTVPGRAIDAAMVRDADVIFVRSVTPVDEALIAASDLRFVGTATAGTEHVDEDALARRRIPFAAAPGSNAMAVVEYVIAAILEVEEPWLRLQSGGTLGIVGFGQVGRRLAAFARSLDWTIRVLDPWVPVAELGGVEATFEEILACDVISLHCSLTREQPWPSFHLFDAHALGVLGSEQWLINAARGSVVERQALAERLRAAGPPQLILDVWEGEPSLDWSLLGLPSVRLATPHIAGYSQDAKWSATQMLIAGLAGVEGWDLGDVVSQTEVPGLSGSRALADEILGVLAESAVSPDLDTLRALVRACYDIRVDDAGLRRVGDASDADARSRGFDLLRKDYPLRRELSAVLADLRGEPGRDAGAGVGRFTRALMAARYLETA